MIINGAHCPHVLWRPFDTHYKGTEDMDMGEVTRQELDLKLDAMEARMGARFSQLEAQMHKNTAELIKWIVGLGVALTALGAAGLSLVINSAEETPPAPVVINIPAQAGQA